MSRKKKTLYGNVCATRRDCFWFSRPELIELEARARGSRLLACGAGVNTK